MKRFRSLTGRLSAGLAPRFDYAIAILFFCLLTLLAGNAAATACGLAQLPPPVAEMRQAILDAARSRDLEALRGAIEWNEIKPDIEGGAANSDPIAQLVLLSGDGTGKRLLARIEAILEADCKAPPTENVSEPYVWPRFADARFETLSAAEIAELEKLLDPEEIAAMRAADRWTGWRLAIGRDGTWHSLRKGK